MHLVLVSRYARGETMDLPLQRSYHKYIHLPRYAISRMSHGQGFRGLAVLSLFFSRSLVLPCGLCRVRDRRMSGSWEGTGMLRIVGCKCFRARVAGSINALHHI